MATTVYAANYGNDGYTPDTHHATMGEAVAAIATRKGWSLDSVAVSDSYTVDHPTVADEYCDRVSVYESEEDMATDADGDRAHQPTVTEYVDASDDAIEALRSEAATAGDESMVRSCRRALRGDEEAMREVYRALRDAAAQG